MVILERPIIYTFSSVVPMSKLYLVFGAIRSASHQHSYIYILHVYIKPKAILLWRDFGPPEYCESYPSFL